MYRGSKIKISSNGLYTYALKCRGQQQDLMERIFLLIGLTSFLTQCQPVALPQTDAGVLNQEIKIGLNQTVTLKENNRTGDSYLGKIKLVQLEDSRCPAHTTCIRQGAVITSLEIATPVDAQVVRLFIGDMMPNDGRNKRNLTADTLLVALKDKVPYQLILKDVLPYPGTSEDAPRAVLLVKRP